MFRAAHSSRFCAVLPAEKSLSGENRMPIRTVVLIGVNLVLMATLAIAQAPPQSQASTVSQPDNRYCAPRDAPNFGAAQDGPAQLPKACIYTALSGTPSPGHLMQVIAGADLQAALNSAQCGDTIALQAGATFTGSFTLPARPCDDQHWITIRTNTPDTGLPPEGTRVTPCYAGVTSLPGRPALSCPTTGNVLAKIVFPHGYASGPIDFAPGANHYRLLGLEITRVPGTGRVTDLVAVRSKGNADHIVVDRSWLHGTEQDETEGGISLSGMTYAGVIDSFFTDFHCIARSGSCTDAKSIGGGTGSYPGGPYKIVNNFLEASGENVLLGGGYATGTPADIEIRRNHFFKPMIWKQGEPGYVGGASGNPFIVKNHFELKNAQRVLFEGNVLENSWGGFTQTGFSILLTPKNQQTQSGANVCPICQVTDVTIRYSTISHVGSGFQISNGISGNGTNGGVALAGERYSIHDVTVDDINATRYSGGGTLVNVANNWKANVLNSITINHITGFPDPDGHVLTVGNNMSNPSMWGFNFTNNLVEAGRYPVWSSSGRSTDCALSDVPVISLAKCFRTYSFSNNAIMASPAAFPASKWPPQNYFPIDAGAVEFVNYNQGNGGDYHLLASSPYENKGTDGKDLGADIDALMNAIAGVR
jgi:hypothetical protein